MGASEELQTLGNLASCGARVCGTEHGKPKCTCESGQAECEGLRGSRAPAPPGCRRELVAFNIWNPFLSDFAAQQMHGKGRAGPWEHIWEGSSIGLPLAFTLLQGDKRWLEGS